VIRCFVAYDLAWAWGCILESTALIIAWSPRPDGNTSGVVGGNDKNKIKIKIKILPLKSLHKGINQFY